MSQSSYFCPIEFDVVTYTKIQRFNLVSVFIYLVSPLFKRIKFDPFIIKKSIWCLFFFFKKYQSCPFLPFEINVAIMVNTGDLDL